MGTYHVQVEFKVGFLTGPPSKPSDRGGSGASSCGGTCFSLMRFGQTVAEPRLQLGAPHFLPVLGTLQGSVVRTILVLTSVNKSLLLPEAGISRG